MTLQSAEITQARSDFEDQILDQTCTIQTLTRTADGVGGFSESWANTYTGIACRLGVDSRSASMGVDGDREVYADSYILNIPHDQAISEGDRVITGGITYEVTHAKDTAVQWVFLNRAVLRRLDG